MIEQRLALTLPEATQQLFHAVEKLPLAERETVVQAFYLAAARHYGQYRKSGELYIIHPVQVAIITAQAGGDTASIATALLHDVLEDTETETEEISRLFGSEICRMVEALTKLPMFSRKEQLEKLYAKCKEDPRIALVKMADQATNHVNGSQLVFQPAKHREHLEELDFYLDKLAKIPDVPKEIAKVLERVSRASWESYHKRAH